MKFNIILLLFIGFFVSTKYAQGIYLDINIYHSFELKAVEFIPISGKYILEADQVIQGEFELETLIRITPFNDSLLLQIGQKKVGLFKDISFYGRGYINAFSISNDSINLPKRKYDDHLKIRVVHGKLQLINHIELEKYQ